MKVSRYSGSDRHVIYHEGDSTLLKLNAVVLVVGLVFGNAANAETYTCKLKGDQGGWIPRELIIKYDRKSDEVEVLDTIIQYYIEKPVVGGVATENAKRITFKWILPFIKNRERQVTTRFRYRATYLKGSHKMTMTGTPDGYSNNFTGRGSCSVK